MKLGRRPGAAMLLALPLFVACEAAAQGTSAAASRRPPTELIGRIDFAAESAVLGEESRAQLDAILLRLPDPAIDPRRIQVLGFAAGDKELVSATRRLSLDRALAVRSYLVDRSVAINRIDVRALGTTNIGEQGMLDQVHVVLGIADVPAPRPKAR